MGLGALVWFLIRVIPKPSRATYPCQRVAFPLASGFVVWLIGLSASLVAFRKAKRHLAQARYVLAAVCIVVSVASIYVALSYTSGQPTLAAPPSRVAQAVNAPIGIGKGIHAGRVAWIHDPNATDWLGSPQIQGVEDGYWWEPNHTSQAVVDEMLSKALRALAGEQTDAAAWDAIFRYYNREHGKGDVGYQAGEKIMVKVNFVGQITSATGTDKKRYSFRDNYPNTSPQAIHALLDQLVNVAGVDDADISLGDTLCTFTDEYFNYLDPCFPDVNYIDWWGGDTGRSKTTTPSSNPRIYWSDPNSEFAWNKDYVASAYHEAEYLINFANLKGHYNQAGVTMCGKNHYGSLCRTPDAWGYYNLHNKQIWSVPGMGHYRPLVDLMGHPEIGGKTVLFLLDGLYPNKHALAWMRDFPYRWQMPPFDGDWASSIFASQDPVAIDSVGFDFLYAEWPEDNGPGGDGADDYLHEAALIPNPLSGYVYDPNHDGGLTESLGVHEHWNNPIDKQYSRNLGADEGIELVTEAPTASPDLTDDVVVPGATIQQVYSAGGVFFEGATWDPNSQRLFFTRRTGTYQILRLDSPDNVAVWLSPSPQTNGMFLSRDGRLLTADESTKQIRSHRIGATGPEDTTVLCTAPDKPNDLCELTNGNIYFTCPDWSITTHQGVYLLKPDGSVTRLNNTLHQPNGIITSLDETKLYVSESSSGPGGSVTTKRWWVFPINSDGTLGAGSVFFRPADPPSNSDPDGMTIDERGNLYFCGLGGVWVVSPDGQQLDMIRVSQNCSNICFGGPDRKTLYITCQDKVYSLAMLVRGGE